MKTLVILILFIIVGITTLYSQTNYYTESKIFEGVGYKYKCNVSSSRNVILYNIDNKYVGKYPKYRTTGRDYEFPEYDRKKLYIKNVSTETKIKNIVNSNFSGITITQPQNSAQRKTFNITFYINSGTGKVDELEFDFVNFVHYVHYALQSQRVSVT